MAAKKKEKAWCAHSKREQREAEYDALVKEACDMACAGEPVKEHLLLEDLPVKGPLEGYPENWWSKKSKRRRMFRADYALLERRIVIEVDGISPHGTRNRHLSPDGFSADAEKGNITNLLGFRQLRYTPHQLRAGNLKADLLYMKSRGML